MVIIDRLFQYYNMWLSLAGAILCVAVMFLISWGTALVTFFLVMALYLLVSHKKPGNDQNNYPIE